MIYWRPCGTMTLRPRPGVLLRSPRLDQPKEVPEPSKRPPWSYGPSPEPDWPERPASDDWPAETS